MTVQAPHRRDERRGEVGVHHRCRGQLAALFDQGQATGRTGYQLLPTCESASDAMVRRRQRLVADPARYDGIRADGWHCQRRVRRTRVARADCARWASDRRAARPRVAALRTRRPPDLDGDGDGFAAARGSRPSARGRRARRGPTTRALPIMKARRPSGMPVSRPVVREAVRVARAREGSGVGIGRPRPG